MIVPIDLLKRIKESDKRALARAISVVENELSGYEELLLNLEINQKIPVIGITGPPGAGKSTIVNAMISFYCSMGKKVGVIAIDPTSPFNFGSLLGDRIRMSEHFTNENVFIRSLATRGSLGGLSAKSVEVCDVMRSFPFDVILVETVGIGQSEVEIVGLADTTVVVLIPEAGDDVQNIKSGIMEIADVFVVNKSDRDGAEQFFHNLKKMLSEREAKEWDIPVIKTIASKQNGIEELIKAIEKHINHKDDAKKQFLLTEKAYKIIQNNRMKDIDKHELYLSIQSEMKKSNFNLYLFSKKYY